MVAGATIFTSPTYHLLSFDVPSRRQLDRLSFIFAVILRFLVVRCYACIPSKFISALDQIIVVEWNLYVSVFFGGRIMLVSFIIHSFAGSTKNI